MCNSNSVQLASPTVTTVLIAAASAAHNLCSKTNIHCILSIRLNISLSYFGKQVIHIAFLNFIQLQYVVLLGSTSKSLPIHSNLTFHICYIMFEEKVVGTFKDMGRIDRYIDIGFGTSAPTHLGLNNRPICAPYPIQGSPAVLLKLQVAPKFILLTSFGFKK